MSYLETSDGDKPETITAFGRRWLAVRDSDGEIYQATPIDTAGITGRYKAPVANGGQAPEPTLPIAEIVESKGLPDGTVGHLIGE